MPQVADRAHLRKTAGNFWYGAGVKLLWNCHQGPYLEGTRYNYKWLCRLLNANCFLIKMEYRSNREKQMVAKGWRNNHSQLITV
jgi:hypothetical protein